MTTNMYRSIRLSMRPVLGEARSSRLTSNPSIMKLHSSARLMAEEEMKQPTQSEEKQTSPSSLSALSMPTLTPSQALPEAFRASQQQEQQRSPIPSFTSSSSSPFSPSPSSRLYDRSTPMERRLPHKLHVQATRNNCIITLTTNEGAVMKRESSGTLGFKNAARSEYEAAYRVAMAMIEHIQTNRVAWRIASLDVIWKGMGMGREAVYRAMLSNEGEAVRNLVKKVSDNTAIKVGGTRPKKRRML